MDQNVDVNKDIDLGLKKIKYIPKVYVQNLLP